MTDRAWVHLRVHTSVGVHRLLLAGYVPALLERLPEGVNGWQYIRGTGGDPYLRLAFHADPAAWRELLTTARSWSAALVADGVATRLTLDAGEHVDAAAAEAMQADSEAVLAQLRLARVRAVTVPPDAVCAAGMADIAQAFCGADWRRRVRAIARRPRRLPSWATVDSAVAMLAPWWVRRAETLTRYRQRVRPDLSDAALDRLLRAHHNRIPGATPRAYALLYACLDSP